MNCKTATKVLGTWLDGEVDPTAAHEIEKHIEGCVSCLEERNRLLRLQGSLKSVLDARAAGLAFEPFWNGVRRRIVEDKPVRGRFLERLRVALPPQRLAWAIPLVIVLLLGAFSLEQFFPKWRGVLNKSNLAAVESVDGHGFNVAVFRESKTKTTVIWLFENQEEEDEASGESASTDSSF